MPHEYPQHVYDFPIGSSVTASRGVNHPDCFYYGQVGTVIGYGYSSVLVQFEEDLLGASHYGSAYAQDFPHIDGIETHNRTNRRWFFSPNNVVMVQRSQKPSTPPTPFKREKHKGAKIIICQRPL
jgi:hypothetical protein